jgi:putative ABC transport system ATP-binding protein
MSEPILRARNVSRRAGALSILCDVSLELAPGEWVSLVGPSGCGKTSLLMVLGLLDAPTEGSVLLDGEDVAALSPAARAAARLARVGFVFQTQNLLDHLTTRDNVALPAWRLGGTRKAALRAADELLERFGLAARADARAGTLSTGEAQRAALARALVNRPALVLADEPTGSLDSANAAAVLELLGEVNAAGATLLVATHDAGVAARGRRLAMRDGQIEIA